MTDDLITVKEAALRLGCRKGVVYDLIRLGLPITNRTQRKGLMVNATDIKALAKLPPNRWLDWVKGQQQTDNRALIRQVLTEVLSSRE